VRRSFVLNPNDPILIPNLNSYCNYHLNFFFFNLFSLSQPPENELQKSHDNNTTLSEHQLRVQASLQKLNIPDWYKQYKSTNHNTIQPPSSCIIKKKSSEIGRWTGLNSKTTSLSSLGSRCEKSPIILSPSAYSNQSQPGFSRLNLVIPSLVQCS
jgi:hypothetical protein